MSRLRSLALVAGLLALAALPLDVRLSTAAFTSTTRSGVSTVGAAPDWTPPTVALASPGGTVKDTVTLSATASDAETGVASVVFQYQAVGTTTWTTICTSTASPYTCAWNTVPLTDGAYDLRAVATDRAGYSATSAAQRTTVANRVFVVLTGPGDLVRGTVPLQTTLYNAGSATYTVRVEYSVAGADKWFTICNNLASPYTCSWNTTTVPGGDYDLRSVAVSGGTSVYSAVVPDVLVDNQAPSVTMVDPGTPLSGTRTFAATASDTLSGVARVDLQYAASGGSFTTMCSITLDPYSCSFDTTKLADGAYSFRALATDFAGNVATSSAVTTRIVDNTISSVSVADPGAYVRGQVTLTAAASSTAGVRSVTIQRAPAGTSTWTDVCSRTASPYTCTWDTTAVADGLYDLRAVLVDGNGVVTTSAVVANRRVDNNPLRAADVQATNGGATVGRLEAGDRITFTYTEQVVLGSVTPGWSGAPLAVQVRLRDGGLLGLGAKGDTLDVLRTGSTVNLGSVNLREDFAKNGKTILFNATMEAGTVTVGGVVRSTVTLTLGSVASGGGLRTAATAQAMVWTPSGAVQDPAGNVTSTAPATESGASDRDF